MDAERRLLILLVVAGLVALPATILSVSCLGRSCDAGAERSGTVPFCSLEPTFRDLIVAGSYEGRSPDVLGVSGPTLVRSRLGDGLRVPWPEAAPDGGTRSRVPLVFLGKGVREGSLPAVVTLDQVAPTLADALGIERPFPEVRSGRAVTGVVSGDPAPLAVAIVWKGMSASGRRPTLPAGAPAATGTAAVASLPLDPTAVLTTIGTGGIPSQHGITGSTLRGDRGITTAFSATAPGTVIATLGDDLDELSGGASSVALVATDETDRGLIGGTWYGGEDDDVVIEVDAGAPAQVQKLLGAGLGDDEVPDLLGVVLQGRPSAMDRDTHEIVAAVLGEVPGAVIAITATGGLGGDEPGVPAAALAGVPAYGGDAPGGVFIDRDVAEAEGIPTQSTVDALRAVEVGGEPLFDDAFAGYAVRFAEYC